MVLLHQTSRSLHDFALSFFLSDRMRCSPVPLGALSLPLRLSNLPPRRLLHISYHAPTSFFSDCIAQASFFSYAGITTSLIA